MNKTNYFCFSPPPPQPPTFPPVLGMVGAQRPRFPIQEAKILIGLTVFYHINPVFSGTDKMPRSPSRLIYPLCDSYSIRDVFGNNKNFG